MSIILFCLILLLRPHIFLGPNSSSSMAFSLQLQHTSQKPSPTSYHIMAANNPPDTQLLDELQALNNTNTSPVPTTKPRRTNSLVLTRTSIPPVLSTGKTDEDDDNNNDGIKLNRKPISRRLSLSSWRSRTTEETTQKQADVSKNLPQDKKPESSSSEKKGVLWNWKPIRLLSQIGKQKLSCLLSVEVVTIQGLPASMNGLRLSVSVKKKETKDVAVQTMPSRVSEGTADFEETLFVRCHVYSVPAGNDSSGPKFEPKPFVIHAFAVDVQELDFGQHTVDLSQLVQESMEKNFEGTQIRQWDMSFNLSGKAKGGELVLKVGFQIIEKEDGAGAGIYNQVEGQKSGKLIPFSPSFGRKRSKSSFSVPSPRISARAEPYTPSQGERNVDFQGIDDLNLDAPPQEPVVTVSQPPQEPVKKTEANLLDDEVDKGVEAEERDGADETQSEDKKSVPSEVVKEVVDDMTRLSELDSIPQHLESMTMEEENDEETKSQKLDEDEEDKVREEFSSQVPENEDGKESANQGRYVNTTTSWVRRFSFLGLLWLVAAAVLAQKGKAPRMLQ